MSVNKQEVKFKYIFAHDYNPIYVNGAHGGVTPRGELVVNFYLERQPLPHAITHEINSNGTVGSESILDPADLTNTLVRFVENGVVLNHQSARDIHFWLGEKIREMEQIEQVKASISDGQQAGEKGFSH